MSVKINRDWFEALASSAPTPGGGGAAGLSGAAGAALGAMVANLTIGKKKYAAVEAEVKERLEVLEKQMYEMLDLIEADAKGFEPLAKAYSLPTSTDEEKAEKEKIMAVALKSACAVPLRTMNLGIEILDNIAYLAKNGSVMAVSDAAAGAQLVRTAVLAASMNVYINTKSMKDRELAQNYNAEADRLNDKAVAEADKIFNETKEALKCR